MTRYTVVWLPAAEDQLADIWVRAQDRWSVTQASARIDAELDVDAGSKGVAVAEGLRQITVVPLKVFFEVQELDRKVEVTAVDRVP
jgi:plasmid stabilization system protein ParE